MNKIANNLISGDAIHAGIILRDELEARHITQKYLANLMQIKANILSELINGKRNFTAEIAVKLEIILGISAEFWLKLQAQYDINKAKIKLRDKNFSLQNA